MIRSIFITVRTGKPGVNDRALLEIGKRPSIEHLIERMKHSKKADSIVLCTTHRREDWVLANLASNLGILCSQGSAENVLDRWYGATNEYAVDFFVSVEGDDLLCEPELIDLALDQYEATRADFIEGDGLIRGAFGHGVATVALKRFIEAKTSDDATALANLARQTGTNKIEQLKNVDEIYRSKDLNLSFDHEGKLPAFAQILTELSPKAGYFPFRTALSYLKERPELRQALK